MDFKIEYISLFSSSKANAFIVRNSETTILIDPGHNVKNLTNALTEIGVNSLDAIIVTHEHQDHVQGVGIHKSFDCKVYTTINTYEAICEKYEIDNFEVIKEKFMVDNFEIDVLKLSHDAVDHIGLILKYEDKEIVHITDTGYIKSEILKKIQNKTLYAIESNYDEEKLMLSSRPLFLKKRIISDSGHLSNVQTKKYLDSIIGDNTKSIILTHLSQEANCPDGLREFYNNSNFDVHIASPNECIKVSV